VELEPNIFFLEHITCQTKHTYNNYFSTKLFFENIEEITYKCLILLNYEKCVKSPDILKQ